MEKKIKTPDEILADLKEISPLALPEYLANCEYRDKTDAFAVLEKAEAEFGKNGGIARSLFETTWKSTVNAVALCILRKTNERSYRKLVRSKATDFSQYAQKAFTFELSDYGPEASIASGGMSGYAQDELKQDILRRGMVRHPTENAKGDSGAQFDVNKYRRSEDFDVAGGASNFVAKNAGPDGTVRGVGGETLQSEKGKTGGDRAKMAEGDHVTPLKMVHDQYAHFIERYVDLDKRDENGKTALQRMANDDSNLQVLSGDKNASKGGGLTNAQFIEMCDKVNKAAEIYKKMSTASPEEKEALNRDLKALGLNANRRRDARALSGDGDLSEEEKKRLGKYKLTDQQKKELLENQKKSERAILKTMGLEGTKTVGLEQIGRLVGHLAGPVGFEIRDSIANGITHGFPGSNAFEAFCKRMWRALKFVLGKIKEILVDFACDFGKMLATLFAGLCKAVKDFFGKFFDLALSGISVIVESVKILMGQGSAAEKGDAILKVVVGFATGILGQYVIDSVLEATGIPDPFSDIIAAIASSVIGSAVTGLFDKIDLFNVKREMRRKRIEEIFDIRRQRLEEASRSFNMAAMETLRVQRGALEAIRLRIGQALAGGDFESLNLAIDDACTQFHVMVPYSSPAEFLEYVRRKGTITIR